MIRRKKRREAMEEMAFALLRELEEETPIVLRMPRLISASVFGFSNHNFAVTDFE